MFAREEPTVRKMEFGKRGEMDINFSDDMVFPEEWTTSRRRLQQQDLPVKFYIKQPNKNSEVLIPSDQVEMVGVDPKKLGFKVNFSNPSLVSLSSQSEADNIIIKFDKSFVLNDVHGNSLVFDSGENGGDSIDFPVPIQTQVDDENPSNVGLERMASFLKVLTLIFMVT